MISNFLENLNYISRTISASDKKNPNSTDDIHCSSLQELAKNKDLSAMRILAGKILAGRFKNLDQCIPWAIQALRYIETIGKENLQSQIQLKLSLQVKADEELELLERLRIGITRSRNRMIGLARHEAIPNPNGSEENKRKFEHLVQLTKERLMKINPEPRGEFKLTHEIFNEWFINESKIGTCLKKGLDKQEQTDDIDIDIKLRQPVLKALNAFDEYIKQNYKNVPKDTEEFYLSALQYCNTFPIGPNEKQEAVNKKACKEIGRLAQLYFKHRHKMLRIIADIIFIPLGLCTLGALFLYKRIKTGSYFFFTEDTNRGKELNTFLKKECHLPPPGFFFSN